MIIAKVHDDDDDDDVVAVDAEKVLLNIVTL